MDRWTLARGAGALVIVGLLMQSRWALHRQSVRLDLAEQRVAVLEARVGQLVEARTRAAVAAFTADDPPARRGEAGRARADRADTPAIADAGKAKPSARARQRTRGNPHAELLERLYDVTDQLAEEEQWDDATYDAVAAVIDDTSVRMEELLTKLRNKQTTAAQARQAALRIRDEGALRLGQILGPSALERLKQAWIDEMR